MFKATRNALTLAELVIVLVIVVALSSMLVPLCSAQMTTAATATTQGSLAQVRDAIIQYWSDTKHLVLDGVTTSSTENDRFKIEWLFADPVSGTSARSYDRNSRIGWNGPYMSGVTGDMAQWNAPVLLDGWQNRLVTQLVNPSASLKDVRIVSGGPNGIIDIPAATPTSSLTTQNIGDDIYVSLMLR